LLGFSATVLISLLPFFASIFTFFPDGQQEDLLAFVLLMDLDVEQEELLVHSPLSSFTDIVFESHFSLLTVLISVLQEDLFEEVFVLSQA